MKVTRLAVFVAGVGIALASAAGAETYRASFWLPAHETNTVSTIWLTEELAKRTDGALTFEIHTDGALMPAKAHLQGVGDGVVQLGFHTSGYTPSDLPLSNALSGYGFIEPDPTTMGIAFADWVINDPAGNEEYRKHGVVPTGGFSTPLYPIICNTSEPVVSLAQLQGKKIRFPGGLISKLATDLGAVPVNMPAPEIYQALQNGSIDCAGILATYLNIDNSLDEVSKSTTLLNWTGSYNSPHQLWNKDFWQGLTTEQRGLIFELSARAQARAQIAFEMNQRKAFENATAKGHVIVEPDATITDAVKAWVDAGVGDMAGTAKETYGVQDPEALFASFKPYVDKWHGLVGGMKDKYDEDELTKLIQDNLYADLDPATYGMN